MFGWLRKKKKQSDTLTVGWHLTAEDVMSREVIVELLRRGIQQDGIQAFLTGNDWRDFDIPPASRQILSVVPLDHLFERVCEDLPRFHADPSVTELSARHCVQQLSGMGLSDKDWFPPLRQVLTANVSPDVHKSAWLQAALRYQLYCYYQLGSDDFTKKKGVRS